MKVNVDVNFATILEIQRRAGNNKAQIQLASDVKRLSDPYVPMLSGTLKNHAVIAGDGSSITYQMPYAHYQYAGQVLVGRAPKRPNGKQLSYSGGGLRGPKWDDRMMADKSGEIEKNLRGYILGG